MTDHQRYSLFALAFLAFLAATAVVGPFLGASISTEEAESSRRRLNWRIRARAKKKKEKALLASLADPKTVVPRVNAAAISDAAGGPNIIYIQHEALSGSIALNTDAGAAAMPFFQDRMKNDPDFYVFEHARAPSGNTLDAFPAMMTGCMPYTKDAVDWLHTRGRSVGYDFHRLGYHTASFSSRNLDETMTTGKWKVLYDMLVGDMDKVIDPLSQKLPVDNKGGTDDRRMLPLFEDWLRELADKDESRPFYAQFYNFNQHYPYMKEEGAPTSTKPYYQSLATTDEFFRGLFEILEKTGRLQNTIIVGSGDHGEEPFKNKGLWPRLRAFNSNILHSASYTYYPKELMPDSSMADRLRSNTQKLIHTTDLYQTIQGVIQRSFAPDGAGGGNAFLPMFFNLIPSGCITGVDLAEVDIPEDRVVISWNFHSSKGGTKFYKGDYWALSTKDLSLYHRKQKMKFMHQGKNSVYVLKYGNCTRDTSPSDIWCQASVTEEYKEYFRGAIQWIKHTPMYDEGFKTSKLVKYFSKKVGWKETA